MSIARRIWDSATSLFTKGGLDGSERIPIAKNINTDGAVTLNTLNEFLGTYGFNTVTPTAITVGGVTAGSTFPANKSIRDLLFDALNFVAPQFTAFSIQGQDQIVESGTTLSSTRTFNWTTSGSSNIVANSIDIISPSLNYLDLPNTGTYTITDSTIQNLNPSTFTWTITGTSSSGSTFNRTFVITWSYLRFYGPTSISPANSAQVRLLPQSSFNTNNTFDLVTGTTESKFSIFLPPSKTIVSVTDIGNLNADLTSSYIALGTVNVLDAGGTSRVYNKYELNLGAPYPSNTTHRITTN